MHNEVTRRDEVVGFYHRPEVRREMLDIADGIPFGIEIKKNRDLGMGGVCAAWGKAISNEDLSHFLTDVLGKKLEPEAILNLSELGFRSRHHIPRLTQDEQVELEVEVGTKILKEAIKANNWEPAEVDAVLIGMSGPVCLDYTQRIAKEAGIPDTALKVSVHKACDSSVAALHLTINPNLEVDRQLGWNVAQELYGKKVLVGGIEGLSRFVHESDDINALQLFANGAGVIGVVPGVTMKILAGKEREVFDEEGVLQVKMDYPHSRHRAQGKAMAEAQVESDNHIRVSGLMHEPEDGSFVKMAGLMGMVKLFVRNGAEFVKDVYEGYRSRLSELGKEDADITVAIVHHANLKINQLLAKNLEKLGVNLRMPWIIEDFGNVSAASNMIAFLRLLPRIRPDNHVMFDGFGAGTYYDCLVVELGSK